MQSLDILAIAAHRDDVEQTCGGTLLKAAQRGQRTGILDLTQGEMGTRGTAEDRAREAADAAKILGVGVATGARYSRRARREHLGESAQSRQRDSRDAAAGGDSAVLERTASGSLHGFGARDTRLAFWQGWRSWIRRKLSALQPSAVSGRASDLGPQTSAIAPHRPFKIIYATLYYDIRPTFVVDISEQFEGKFASILAYKSQFSDQEAGKDLFPAHEEIRARVDAMARFYGMLGGVTYAEPFLQKEVGLVEDLLAIPVKSI